MATHRGRRALSPQLRRLSELAKADKTRQFFSIAHLMSEEALYEAFTELRKKAAVGVDGVTYKEYEQEVRNNIRNLHDRLRAKRYRAQPLRRIYIPKADGKQRPISIPTSTA